MGTLKFYKPMQAVFERMWLSMDTQTSGQKSTFRYCDTEHGLDGFLYSDNALTTVSTNYKYPYSEPDTRGWGQPFAGAETNNNGYVYQGYVATSNATHDLTRTNFANKVANATCTYSLADNGSVLKSFLLENTSSSSVTVKAIERSRAVYATNNYSSNSGANRYFLAWAYYLDEADWVTLEAGESKLITIKITLNDLTQ